MPLAREAAIKALSIDDTLSEGHHALGIVLNYYDWDWAGAEQEYRRALELNPGDAHGRSNYAILLGQECRVEESISQARSAVERDPIAAVGHYALVLVLVQGRRFDDAITAARDGIELDQGYPTFHSGLGWALAGFGKYDEAVPAFRQATSVAPGEAFLEGYLGWGLGMAGRRDEALEILQELERRRTQEHVGGTALADVSLGLGDYDQAIEWLQAATGEHDGLTAHINALFKYDPLRADPSFQALLQRMNFPTVAVVPDRSSESPTTAVAAAEVVSEIPESPSIAVLPFRNMSADPDQEYFCEGMAEELIDALARLDGLRVVARTSSFQFKGQSPDLRDVGNNGGIPFTQVPTTGCGGVSSSDHGYP